MYFAITNFDGYGITAKTMRQCDLCQKWYHRKCENIPDNVFDVKSSTLWHCFNCENNID